MSHYVPTDRAPTDSACKQETDGIGYGSHSDEPGYGVVGYERPCTGSRYRIRGELPHTVLSTEREYSFRGFFRLDDVVCLVWRNLRSAGFVCCSRRMDHGESRFLPLPIRCACELMQVRYVLVVHSFVSSCGTRCFFVVRI